MPWNSNSPKNSEKFILNHIHHITKSGKVSFYLTLRFVNKHNFKFLTEIWTENSNFPENFEKIPKTHIHCKIQSWKISTCFNIQFVNKKYLKFWNTSTFCLQYRWVRLTPRESIRKKNLTRNPIPARPTRSPIPLVSPPHARAAAAYCPGRRRTDQQPPPPAARWRSRAAPHPRRRHIRAGDTSLAAIALVACIRAQRSVDLASPRHTVFF
jgi:hypothetical protein